MIQESAANYCNIVEYACALYLRNGLDKKLFEITFKSDVLAVKRKEGPYEMIANKSKLNSDEYENINRVYEKLKKKGKT